MKRKPSSAGGFTLVEIMISVAIIGLLAAIATPNFARARSNAQRNTCISHLRDIDSAKQQWALENKQTDTAEPQPTDLRPYFRAGTFPQCPAQGEYFVGPMNEDPTCTKASDGHVLPPD